MKFIHTQITGTARRTRSASPSQSGLSCSTPARCAIATTKTSWKNSSSHVARRSASVSSTTRRRGGWRRGAGIGEVLPSRLPRPMRFFEYEAREIVKRAGIPVTDYGFTKDAGEAKEIAERIGGPVVIKSQVLTGGGGEGGGGAF